MVFTRSRAGESLLLFRVLSMHASRDFLAPLGKAPVYAHWPTLGGLFPSDIRDPVTSSASPSPAVLDLSFIVPSSPSSWKSLCFSEPFSEVQHYNKLAMPS